MRVDPLTVTSTCIISILRLQSLYAVSHTDDISWNNPLAAIWSSTEVNVGILCSCLPTLKGSITRIFPRLFSSGSSSQNSNPNPYIVGASSRRSRPPDTNGFDFGNAGHELSPREKGTAQSWIYAAPVEHTPRSPRSPRGESAPYSPSTFGYAGDIKRQAIIEQDVERRDDTSTHGGSDSIRRLVPPSRTYQRH